MKEKTQIKPLEKKFQKKGFAVVCSMGEEVIDPGHAMNTKWIMDNKSPDFFQGFPPRNMDLFVLPPDWNS